MEKEALMGDWWFAVLGFAVVMLLLCLLVLVISMIELWLP